MNTNITEEEISYCLNELPREFSQGIDNLVKADDVKECKQHYDKLKEIVEEHVSQNHLKTKGYEDKISSAYRFMAEYALDYLKDLVIKRKVEKGDTLLKMMNLLKTNTADVYIMDGYSSAVEILSLISEKHKKILKKEVMGKDRDIIDKLWKQNIAKST